MGVKCSQRELADIIGISERSMQDLVKEGMPVEEPGKRGRPAVIDSAAAIQWYVARQVAKKFDSTAGSRESESEKNRLTRWQAELAELNARERQGELVPRAEVVEALQVVFLSLGRDLDSIASRVARPVAAERNAGKVRGILLDEIRRARHDAVDKLGRMGVNSEQCEPAPPAKKKTNKRVGKKRKGAPARKRGAGPVRK